MIYILRVALSAGMVSTALLAASPVPAVAPAGHRGGPGGTDGVDDINGSDGLAVTNRPVGDYRTGLLVTHDEPESGPGVDDDRDPTNFSYVS